MKPEYKALLALKGYLDKESKGQLEQMIKNEEPIEEIKIFVNDAITKKQIKTTRLLNAELAAMEYKEYENKLNPEEKQWIQKFYYEMYGNAIYNVPKDYRLLQTTEMIKESNANRNNYKTDIYDVATKKGILDMLKEEDRIVIGSHDKDRDWETVYTYFGHECALNFIIDQCIEESKIKSFDMRLALVRFYIKMNRIRLMHDREMRGR